jgi:hypothetical protein
MLLSAWGIPQGFVKLTLLKNWRLPWIEKGLTGSECMLVKARSIKSKETLGSVQSRILPPPLI